MARIFEKKKKVEDDIEEDIKEEINQRSKTMVIPRAVSVEEMFNVIDDRITLLDNKVNNLIKEIKDAMA